MHSNRRSASRPKPRTCGWSAGATCRRAAPTSRPSIKQGDRWIAYIGHHGGTDDIPKPVNPLTGKPEFNGTSIVDVTDPANPKYLRHIPGEAGQVRGRAARRWCASATAAPCPRAIKRAVYMLRTFGSEAHEIWNVTDPAKPVLLTRSTA